MPALLVALIVVVFLLVTLGAVLLLSRLARSQADSARAARTDDVKS